MIRIILAAPLATLLSVPAFAADAVCSGIGEQAEAEAAATPHSLKLVFAGSDGKYLGNVATSIEGDGVSLRVSCDGPWVLADLPAGTYEVTATFEGESKTTSVSVDDCGPTETTVTF